MTFKNTQSIGLVKSAAALAVSLACMQGAHADTITGTIYKQVATDPRGAGSTIDYWQFSLSADANIVIDVRANEGLTTVFGQHPLNYVDLNGDGEITLADTHFHIFQDTVSGTPIASADDISGSYTPGANGWADGSLNSRDSYLSTAFQAGTYIIAFGDYQITNAEAIAGFNATDALTGQTTATVPGQDHFDYQLALTATNFDTGAEFTVALQAIPAPNPSAVPVPAAIWLFGSAMAGFGVTRNRRKAVQL